MIILVANIGSTSFKYRLFNMDDGSAAVSGGIERIGQSGSGCPDYETAISRCMNDICGEGKPLKNLSELSAIGFKAVHAGRISGAKLVDDHVLSAMEEFSFVAPAHNPPYIAAMRSFGKTLPSIPLVALFETAFFDQMDEAAVTYGVPYAWKEELGVRRYGFHGASHRAASERAQAILGRKDLRHISCHLGGSSSLAAIRSGIAMDTSFGMSPQSGLPQNNRTGDFDAFAALFVMKKLHMSADEMAEALGRKSGLAGISGTSGDIRDIQKASVNGDSRARLAIDVFVRSVRHYIGAFLVELGGLDVLTFSGGIGENSSELRSDICAQLDGFGIILDRELNNKAFGEFRISPKSSPATILILPADEERIVANAAAEVICGH